MEPTTLILVVGPRKLVCTDFIGVVRPAYRRRIISPLYPIIPAPSRSHPLFALPCFGSEKVGFSKNASRKTLKKLFKICFSKRTRQRGHFALRLAIIRFLSSENEIQTYFACGHCSFSFLEQHLLLFFLSKGKGQCSPCKIRFDLVLRAQETDDSES